MRAADDVGRVREATLRLEVDGLSRGAGVDVVLNGRRLAAADPASDDTVFDVPCSAVLRGDNELHVRVVGQTIGTPLIEAVTLDVSYRR